MADEHHNKVQQQEGIMSIERHSGSDIRSPALPRTHARARNLSMALVWQLNDGKELGLRKGKAFEHSIAALEAGWYEAYVWADANKGPRKLTATWTVSAGSRTVTSKKDVMAGSKHIGWFAFEVPAGVTVRTNALRRPPYARHSCDPTLTPRRCCCPGTRSTRSRFGCRLAPSSFLCLPRAASSVTPPVPIDPCRVEPLDRRVEAPLRRHSARAAATWWCSITSASVRSRTGP